MRRFTTIAIGIVLLAAAARAGGEKVGDLKAFCREGQVFITFKELADVKGEQYAVYRSDKPITPDTLAQATKMATIEEDSGAFVSERRLRRKVRARGGEKPWTDQPVSPLENATRTVGYCLRYIIRDNPKHDPKAMLPEGTGLFVYTVKASGKRHFAVVPVVGKAPKSELLAATDKPVDVTVALPGAVLAWKSPTGCGAVYTHWMDGETWDPMVTDRDNPRRRTFEGPAYNFAVGVPEGYDGTKPLPVMFYGHGMSGTYSLMNKASYWPCLWVRHGDRSGSWFMGVMSRDKTRVVNHCEQRFRWSAKWIAAGRANQFWKADMTRVYAHGSSMGGTMCNALALRMGDIFCSLVGSSGATIHRRNGNWTGQAAGLWGPVDKNLPLYDRRYEYADGKLTITEEKVSGVWDYQDYARWSLENMGKETAFLLLSHGKRDGSVPFAPVPDFLDALQKSKRPFAAHWDQRGHMWRPYGVRNSGLGAFKLRLRETVPAFANASNNDDPRKDPSGVVNGRLEWSAGGNDFDKDSKADDIVDSPAMWAMNIRAVPGKGADEATVDVTPRRTQKFKPAPGAACRWENIDFADPAKPAKIASGTVTADKYGLVTVEKLKVTSKGLGSRLVIRLAAK